MHILWGHGVNQPRSGGLSLPVPPSPGGPGPASAGRQAAGHPAASAARAGRRPAWGAREWAILIVLCGALFLDALDVSMVGVALPPSAAPSG